MKKIITDSAVAKSTPKKLYVYTAIIVIIAVLITLLVVYIPDKNGKTDSSNLRLSFEKQGMAIIYGTDGKQKAVFDLELAETLEQQRIGLMYRDTMTDNQGMLFVYQAAGNLNFWMKNTYLPLDLVFFLPDSTIYKIYPDNKPFSESAISPPEKCLMTLELNAGIADRYKLNPGDKIKWQSINK